MIDYHMHTSLCGHARGTMDEYVERALALGFTQIGFSGHFPYPEDYDFPFPDCVIPRQDFGTYLDRARSLRDRYAGKIAIRIGAEFDYLGRDCSYHPLEQARGMELDFCLCSVHIVDHLVVDYKPEVLLEGMAERGWDIDRVYERYFEMLHELARPGFCTTLGHLDLVKKLGPVEGLIPQRNHSAEIDRVLDALADAGIAMEINTAGWDKPCREQYPALEIIRRAVAKGVRITAGSDAHAPEEVGRHFGKLAGILAEVGVSELVAFDKLEPVPYPLNGNTLK